MKNSSGQGAYFNDFTKPVRRIGKLSMGMAMVFAFIPAVYVAVAYNCMATVGQILGDMVLVWSAELVYYFVEPISYFPTLGEGGTYMTFLSGNISGVHVPASAAAQDIAGINALRVFHDALA